MKPARSDTRYLRQDINDHPADQHKLSLEDKDKSLETVNRSNHGKGNDRYGSLSGGNRDNQICQVDASCRQNECTEEIEEYDEAHGEAAPTAHVIDAEQFHQIVDGRVDPSSSLRQQDGPAGRGDSVGDGVWRKLHLERRKVFHHQRGQVTIFTEGEQVLFVKRVDVDLGVFVNDPRRDDNRSTLVGCTDSVNTETTGKTCD